MKPAEDLPLIWRDPELLAILEVSVSSMLVALLVNLLSAAAVPLEEAAAAK